MDLGDRKDLGTATNRTCYLQGVAGDFEGPGEKVHVYVEAGRWWLDGDSGHGRVYGAARCVGLARTYAGEPSTTGNGHEVVLMPASTHSCFLQRLQNRFQDDDAAAYVEVINGTWRLGAFGDVWAGANCVPRKASAYYWPVQADTDLTMKPRASHVCTLNRVQGTLASDWEYVSINEVSSIWTMDVHSSRPDNDLWGGSACFWRQPPISP